jgi:ElaB/YqjD/DUF883 family membrane-anchored ribosome-binding protein
VVGNAANDAVRAASSDVESLRRDLNGLKDTIAAIVSQTGSEAAKSARDMSAAIKEQGASIAFGAAQRGKSLVGDVEDMARRNPLGTLAGALVVGMLIATLGRRR